MNYLTTHYKNLSEQLQARINHIQQCLYEMDAAAGGGIDQLSAQDYAPDNTRPVGGNPNDPGKPYGPNSYPGATPPKPLPRGIAAPWNIIPAPPPGSIYWYQGKPYRYGGTGNGWQNWNGHGWETHWGGPQVPQDRPKPAPPWTPPANTPPAKPTPPNNRPTPPNTRPTR